VTVVLQSCDLSFFFQCDMLCVSELTALIVPLCQDRHKIRTVYT
jgi:hypothetical protein